MTKPFRFNGSIRAAAGKPRRLSILGYGGGLMSVSGFGPLILDLSGLDFPASVTCLRDHENSVAGIVGKAVPNVINSQLVFDIRCADSESARDVISLLESSVELQASVGCECLQSSRVEAGKTVKVNGKTIEAGDNGFLLVSESRLREITIVPCGADSTTSVSIAAKSAKGKAMSKIKAALAAMQKFSDDEINSMTEDEAKANLKKCMKADDDDKKKDDAAAAALIDIMANYDPSTMRAAASERWTVRECKRESLRQLRPSRPGSGVGVSGGGNHRNGVSNGHYFDDDSALFGAAMLVKLGMERQAEKKFGEHTMEASRPLHRASTMSILSAHLQMQGIQHDPNDAEMMIRADASSANVPSLLANVLGKSLELQWQA